MSILEAQLSLTVEGRKTNQRVIAIYVARIKVMKITVNISTKYLRWPSEERFLSLSVVIMLKTSLVTLAFCEIDN